MVRKFKIIIFFFICSFCKTYGQTTLLPLDLAKKIFSKSKFIGIKKYCTDEYNGRPNGNDISKKAKLQFSLLEQTSDKAVVIMTILDKPGKGIDTYLHFSKEKYGKFALFEHWQ
jgi:hypothetical protein